MTTPNMMPRTGSPVTTVKRERHIVRDCGCCDVFFTEKVTALKGATQRKPKSIRNDALAQALQNAGW